MHPWAEGPHLCSCLLRVWVQQLHLAASPLCPQPASSPTGCLSPSLPCSEALLDDVSVAQQMGKQGNRETGKQPLPQSPLSVGIMLYCPLLSLPSTNTCAPHVEGAHSVSERHAVTLTMANPTTPQKTKNPISSHTHTHTHSLSHTLGSTYVRGASSVSFAFVVSKSSRQTGHICCLYVGSASSPSTSCWIFRKTSTNTTQTAALAIQYAVHTFGCACVCVCLCVSAHVYLCT